MHPFAGIFQEFYFKCSELIKQADLGPLQHLRFKHSAEILDGGNPQVAPVFGDFSKSKTLVTHRHRS